MQDPNPKDPHPMKGFPQICFIKNVVSNPNIIIGDYIYYLFDIFGNGWERVT